MSIPKEVQLILEKLRRAGYEAYIVGGCVRDVLRGIAPKDWDVTTNAKPEEIQRVFPKSFYTNAFGTVTVQSGKKSSKESGTATEVEVTTYRIDEHYTDKRHPDSITFAATIEEDLARRDFTVNAMAAAFEAPQGKSKNKKVKIIDPFCGEEDLKAKIIRAVGSPEERFSEDALRMMRAVRFATTLNFTIDPQTLAAIKKHAGLLNFISKERIRDELVKIIEAADAEKGIILLQESGLLKYSIYELEEGIGMAQNKHHIYTVWEHNIHALGWAAKAGYPIDVRLASLLHDVGKSRTKRGEGRDATFYGHEVAGGKMTARILERLKFPKDFIEKVTTLVRYHLFYYNVDEVTERSVRRLVGKVGRQNMDDLILVRIADRKGSGVPKAEPYKIRHFRYIIEKVSRDPVSPKMLKMRGNDIMNLLKLDPGPKVGVIITVLLDEVLDDPKRNTKQYLTRRVKALGALKDEDLVALARNARAKIGAVGEGIEMESKKKYWVK